ncbi:Uncharacterized conserved protein [Mycobacteroides abscessus subsp. bolletii]|nr:Uncharacterized conserved protein [Mycobacteroides abscessus subsp. bolletii]
MKNHTDQIQNTTELSTSLSSVNLAKIEGSFSRDGIEKFKVTEIELGQWPVVYLLHNENEIYVGETVSASRRLEQHHKNPEKRSNTRFTILKHNNFNKSASLDLENFLINRFFADEKYVVINRNRGVEQENYFGKSFYNKIFLSTFEILKSEGFFNNTLDQIENKDLFKLSPFKSLTDEQTNAAIKIIEKIIKLLNRDQQFATPLVIQGGPGTGKTVVAIFLMKFLSDLTGINFDSLEFHQMSDEFQKICSEENIKELQNIRIGLVIPQQSLRQSIKKVFENSPSLDPSQVMSPFQAGKSDQIFDILIVDEAHRLGVRANQPSGPLNKSFTEINYKLFGDDDISHTQLDWVTQKSKVQVLLLDEKQSVKPADLPLDQVRKMIESAKANDSAIELRSQMRMKSPSDYVDWVHAVLSKNEFEPFDLGEYELRFYDNLAQMRNDIIQLDSKYGLSRMIAGYAWPWDKRKASDPEHFDILEDGVSLKWNSTATDWVSSKGSINEAGSIHTIQGYDLNYAGVIIGEDIQLDPAKNRIIFSREKYFDKKGKENNNKLGIKYTDDELLVFVQNIYKVLLTRGIHGTFIYVCDENLRNHMRNEVEKLLDAQKYPKMAAKPDYQNYSKNITVHYKELVLQPLLGE